MPVAAVNRFAAGNQAAVTSFRGDPTPGMVVVQRESRADALTWLRRLLATRGAALGTRMPAAASRLSGWSTDRQSALLRQVRGSVGGFEDAVGAAGLLGDPSSRQVLGILESAQTNDALGNRLVDVFQTSAQPVLGLVIASQIPEPRLRAVLQTHAQAGLVALTAVRRGTRSGSVPAHCCGSPHGYLGRAVRPSWRHPPPPESPRRRRPGRPVSRRSSPRRRSPPPEPPPQRRGCRRRPSSRPATTRTCVRGLHQQVQAEFAYYERWSRRNPMDTKPGRPRRGHRHRGQGPGRRTVRRLRLPARRRRSPSPPATSSDRTTIAGDPVDMARYFVNEGADASVSNGAVRRTTPSRMPSRPRPSRTG